MSTWCLGEVLRAAGLGFSGYRQQGIADQGKLIRIFRGGAQEAGSWAAVEWPGGRLSRSAPPPQVRPKRLWLQK